MDHGGPFPAIWLGTALRAGLGALEREIAAGGLRAEDFAEVDRELAILELFEPSASVIRRERLRQDGRWISIGAAWPTSSFTSVSRGSTGRNTTQSSERPRRRFSFPDRAARKERLARILAEGEKSSVLPIPVGHGRPRHGPEGAR
jgi:hypothetical protein